MLIAARIVPALVAAVLVAGAPRASPRPRPVADPMCVEVTFDGQVAFSAPGACEPSPVATVCRDEVAGDTAVERVTVAQCIPSG